MRRGVSLYSLQEAYGRGALGLEGCVAAVEAMGSQGIEILSDQMIRGATDADDAVLEEWDEILERHPLDLVANDVFVNSWLFKDRWLTLDEQSRLLSAELRLSHRLGFRLVRIVSRTDPAVVPLVLPLAERLGITMALEIHAGMSFEHPMSAAWIEQMRELDNPHVGLVVDFGIYVHRLPRVVSSYFRGLGVSEDVIAWVTDLFESGADGVRAYQRNPDITETDDYLMPEELTRLFRRPIDAEFAYQATGYENTPLDTLDEYLPWIRSVHAKFWEMVPDPGAPGGAQEFSIDYSRLIGRLAALGYEGYLCSEYEGQRFVLPGQPIDDLGQLRLHQLMLGALMGQRAEG